MAETASPELVLSHLDSLPTLPAVAVRLLQLTATDDTAASDLVRLLRGDQSLTAKILSRANSAATGMRSPVSTLEKAVPLLGFAAVRSIVLANSVFECFSRPTHGNGGGFDRLEFWKHALAVACAARRLAQKRTELGVDPEDAFVAGLLHDLGKLALGTVFPKAYDRIVAQANHSRGDIADNERAVLGADHTVAGRRLAERWKLPRALQDVMWLHHLAADALPGTVARPRLIGVVQLADTVAREQRIGYSGNHTFYELSPHVAERLGFSSECVAEAVQKLAMDVSEHAQLLGIDSETTEGVYYKAMRQANQELGELNTELVSRNRRLAAAERYFKALARFEEVMRDWSDVGAVVTALVQAAAPALQRPRLAAFGLRERAAAVDVAWARGAGEVESATQAVGEEFSNWLARPLSAELLVAAPACVRNLVDRSMLDEAADAPWLLPIRHDGELVGGILYSGAADEPARLGAEADELRSFLTSVGLALARANAQAAARRMSEDLAETNRRLQQMQAELLRSRTLSMIAEMAAGAGHELNSPLTVISGRAQMLAAQVQDPDAKRALKVISDKAHECSGIVSELMEFARPRLTSLEPVDLAELLQELRAEWLAQGRVSPAQLRLVVEEDVGVGGQPPRIAADRAQIKAVFRELLSNATDAVGDSGALITIRARRTLEEGTLEVLVEDAGCGMPPAVLQRAFDPFYSHRNAGRRRGLGLPRAYRVVEAHHGRIWLESRPDEGTTAHVVLPRAGGAAAGEG